MEEINVKCDDNNNEIEKSYEGGYKVKAFIINNEVRSVVLTYNKKMFETFKVDINSQESSIIYFFGLDNSFTHIVKMVKSVINGKYLIYLETYS